MKILINSDVEHIYLLMGLVRSGLVDFLALRIENYNNIVTQYGDY